MILSSEPEPQVVFNILAIFVLGAVTSGAMTWGHGFIWSQIYVFGILIFVNLGLWFTVLTEHFKDRIPEKLHAAVGLVDGDANGSSTPKILRHLFDAVAIYFAYDLYIRIYEWLEFKDLVYSSRVLILIATSLTVVCTGACIYLSFFLQNNGDKNLLGWFVGKNVILFGTEDKSLIEGFVLLFFGLAVFTAMVPCICAIGLDIDRSFYWCRFLSTGPANRMGKQLACTDCIARPRTGLRLPAGRSGHFQQRNQ